VKPGCCCKASWFTCSPHNRQFPFATQYDTVYNRAGKLPQQVCIQYLTRNLICIDRITRVEALKFPGESVTFDGLRSSIKSLQIASAQLDLEKAHAISGFYELVISPCYCREQKTSVRCKVQKIIHSVVSLIKGARPPTHARGLEEAAERVHRVNKKLVSFEKGFLSEEGLPGREWFKHFVVAPGKYLGKPPFR
jgi:hypothetical protein